MDVHVGVRIIDSDRTALKQITKEEKCSMSDLMVRAMKPYLSGEAELPYKSAGRQVATTLVIDHEIRDTIKEMSDRHGLSVNEALQFMTYEFLREMSRSSRKSLRRSEVINRRVQASSAA
jgi:hypothetical protein